jgi:hypothetical protein
MDITTLAKNVVNQFIVKPGGNATGINGYVFDVLGDEDIMLSSDITDHFVEENFAIQDHIALRPPKFTLTGYVGELTDIFQMSFLNILTTTQSLGGIAEYTPAWTAQATQVYDKLMGVASEVGVVVNQAKNLYQTFSGLNTSSTKQQKAYNYFLNLWMARILCTVETPWAIWEKMAIENVRIIQKDDNKFVSEFSITFKQIRVVSSKSYTPWNLAMNDPAGHPLEFEAGRVFDNISPEAFTAGSVAGQTVLGDGSLVNSDLLSKNLTVSNGGGGW